MSLTTSLYTGRSALITRQTQMSVIGNNIANADKAGYHRQTAEIVENAPINNRHYQTGTGSRVETVVREFDAALEANLRTSLEQEAYYSELSKYTQATEEVMAIEGKSIMADAFTEFSNSLQDLANNPGSEIERRAFLANSERVATTFNQQHILLTDLRDRIAASSTDGVIPGVVSDFNALTTDLANLNDQIMIVERTYQNKQEAIEFRDQRDQIVAELAQLANITVSEENDGSYTLMVDSVTVVDSAGGVNGDLTFTHSGTNPPTIAFGWSHSATTPNLDKGTLQGLNDSFEFVQARIAEMETYATTFATEMNTRHAAGFDAAGNAGGDLFDATTPGAMTVSISDPDLVAASDSIGNIGDGDNALNLWTGINTPIAGIGDDTLINRADRMIDFIAVERNKAEGLHRSSESSVELFKSVISEKSGVSIDEEMVYMLETQRAFQGAAKFITTVDQLVQTVINLI
ncbi:MAG: flagellar hook-associated protein FlgK [Lentisphaeraceae bacterium]|nr:flagellar hook-associated protein FlgK [Lentisphaeraceae bacterium]